MKRPTLISLLLLLSFVASAQISISEKKDSTIMKQPEFPGGIAKFHDFIERNQRDADYRHRYLGGNIGVVFTIEKDGALKHVKIVNRGCKDCNEEAIRLLKKSPKWIPGTRNGIPAKTRYAFIVHLRSDIYDPGDPAGPPEMLTDSEMNIKIFIAVEQMPEFPGGTEEFQKYIHNNIKYPPLALKNNIEGKVYVGFIVEKDGSLTDVKVLRGIGNGCDEEAIRLIKNSPKWNPGIQNGRNVRVQYNVPINFALPKDN